jgi:FtsH-binding integral membrane protein
MIAHAATADSLTDLISIVQSVFSALVPLIVSLAVVVFLWGVLKYVIAGSNKDGKEEGRKFMIWGIIGLVVMVSVWGLVAMVKNTFFESSTSPVDPPGGSNPPPGGGNNPPPGGGVRGPL